MHPSRDGGFIFNGHPIPRGEVIVTVLPKDRFDGIWLPKF